MTVAELIGLLQDQKPEAEVYVFRPAEPSRGTISTEAAKSTVSGHQGSGFFVIISPDGPE